MEKVRRVFCHILLIWQRKKDILTSTRGWNQYMRQMTITNVVELKLMHIKAKLKPLGFLKIRDNDLNTRGDFTIGHGS